MSQLLRARLPTAPRDVELESCTLGFASPFSRGRYLDARVRCIHSELLSNPVVDQQSAGGNSSREQSLTLAR
jgi:hypothetical protein